MALDTDHDILKIVHGNEPGTPLVRFPEPFDRILLVEIVQELAELAIGYHALSVLPEVQFYERRFYVERNPLVQFSLGHHLNEFSCHENLE